MKELISDRLKLREWRESDCMDLHEYGISEFVGPNAGWKPHKDIEETKVILKMFMEQKTTYAIEYIDNNKVIGGIGLHKRFPDESKKKLDQREIGFVLNPDYWGKAIMPEAVNRLLRYAFEELNLDLVWCGHYEENTNSKRVNEKCGFKFSFIKEENVKLLDDKRVKTHYYSMTKEAYNEYK